MVALQLSLASPQPKRLACTALKNSIEQSSACPTAKPAGIFENRKYPSEPCPVDSQFSEACLSITTGHDAVLAKCGDTLIHLSSKHNDPDGIDDKTINIMTLYANLLAQNLLC